MREKGLNREISSDKLHSLRLFCTLLGITAVATIFAHKEVKAAEMEAAIFSDLSGGPRDAEYQAALVDEHGEETMKYNFGLVHKIEAGLEALPSGSGRDSLKESIYNNFQRERRALGMPDPVPGHIMQPSDWESSIGEN